MENIGKMLGDLFLPAQDVQVGQRVPVYSRNAGEKVFRRVYKRKGLPVVHIDGRYMAVICTGFGQYHTTREVR